MIQSLCKPDEYYNNFYIKREDLLPFSFGGNKARKAAYFFEEIIRLKCDTVVTYGSAKSNHCRVTANMAAANGLNCVIISPYESDGDASSNNILIRLLDTRVIICPLTEVKKTVKNTMKNLRDQNATPYFIEGGGHGNLGTQAYVDCYEEICAYERAHNTAFDYVFHASGTGSTQAGLVCGNLLSGERWTRKIVGISIARPEERGHPVVVQSIADYIKSRGREIDEAEVNDAVIFTDRYNCGGYGKYNQYIFDTIKAVFKTEGVALDPVYTGKAFWGMQEYIKENQIKEKNILFIHTGGQPILFDELRNMS